MDMHIDYARGMLERSKRNAEMGFIEKDEIDMEVVKLIINYKEEKFFSFAKQIGNEKTKSIIETIEKNIDNKYFKITYKMKYAIAKDILEKSSIEEIINLFA